MPRARIVETYRTFIRSHHPLAGSAAPDLLAWRSREAVPDHIALLKAQALQYPIAELALLHCLDSAAIRNRRWWSGSSTGAQLDFAVNPPQRFKPKSWSFFAAVPN